MFCLENQRFFEGVEGLDYGHSSLVQTKRTCMYYKKNLIEKLWNQFVDS